MKTWKVLGLLSMVVASQTVYAAEPEEDLPFDAIIALSGGIATNSDAGANEDFTIGYSQVDYDADHDSQVRGVYGGFLGAEFPVLSSWALQLGLSYYQAGTFDANGTVAQGFNPATTAEYEYHYDIISHQVLVEGKLLTQWYEIYRPYVSLGLGAAFNEAKDFSVDYPPSLAITPTYDDHTTTSFTYNVGIGVDVDITEYMRLGLGYRFTDLGKVGLGQGEYDPFEPSDISETLEQSHLYTQEVLAQLTFLL